MMTYFPKLICPPNITVRDINYYADDVTCWYLIDGVDPESKRVFNWEIVGVMTPDNFTFQEFVDKNGIPIANKFHIFAINNMLQYRI